MARLYSILLRLALSRVLEERLKEAPVLFLDDPESELDPRWIGPLLGLVPESTQTLVTACRPLSEAPARFRHLKMDDLKMFEAHVSAEDLPSGAPDITPADAAVEATGVTLSRRMTRGGGFEPVAPVLDRMLTGLKIAERFASAQATELWTEVVGPEVIARTRAVGVRDGELLVEVRGSVWMGHLSLLRQRFLEEINERLPEGARLQAIRLVPMRTRRVPSLNPTPDESATLTPTREGHSYDARNIQVLKGLEGVRKRPAMYIGSTGLSGLHHLVYEVVDNSVDEALAGFCTEVSVTIHNDASVTVVDNGRGVPVDIHPAQGRPAVEVVMTTLHAGGKFDDNSYKVSGGLHGVGVSVVNALSEWLEVEVDRDGKRYHQRYELGIVKTDLKLIGDTDRTGTVVHWKPDSTIFETLEYNFDTLSQRLRELAFLNKGIRIQFLDERTGKKHDFQYEGGIASFVKYLNENKTVLHPAPIYHARERDKTIVEFSLQYNDGYVENVFSFVNNINTIEGGHASDRIPRRPDTHDQQLRRARGDVEVAQGHLPRRRRRARGPDRGHQREDPGSPVRGADQGEAREHGSEGRGRVRRGRGDSELLRGESPGRPEDRREVHRDGAGARGGPEGARSRAEEVDPRFGLAPREARRLPAHRSRPVRDLPGRGRLGRRLRQDGSRPEVPGDPAPEGEDPECGEGLARQDARERGDPKPHHRARHGIADEFNADKARYHRIIIMTDADVDGAHIRTLLLTFFFRHMRPLIERGYIYIAIPPLYRVAKGKEIRYAYNEAERETAMEEMGRSKGIHLQRYKGLGEMNPDQLWSTTMDPETRSVLKVTLDDFVEADRMFTILMGDQVEPRRKFIEEYAENVRNLDV